MTNQAKKSSVTRGQHKLKPMVRHISLALALGAGTFLHSGLTFSDEVRQDKSAVVDNQNQQDAQSTSAQDQNPQVEGSALPSVTVTAQKREENVQTVTDAISTLDGKKLVEDGVGRSASEILNYVPNASAGTQQHSRPRWWIRGVGAGQQQYDLSNPVGFYQDDVYISNASATGFPLFDLDHVEILRGPQGTLWGKNTTGGAINVLSKKPSFNDTDDDDYVKVDYGTYNDKLLEGGVGAVILDDRLAGRISFHQEDQDGRFNNLFTGTKDGSLRDGAIRAQLLAEITPDLEALLNFHYRKYETNGAITTVESYAPNGVFRNGYVPSKDPNNVSSNAPVWGDTSQNGVSLNVKWQIGKLAFTSITGYEDFQSETLADGDNTPLEISRGHVRGESSQWSQEFRLASPREDRLNWLGGLHFFHEDIDYASQNAQLPGVASLLTPVIATPGAAYNASVLNHKDDSFAIFGSSTYNLTEQLAATVGLRWTTEEKKYTLSRKGSTGATNAGEWSNLSQWWNSYAGPIQAAGTLASGTFNTSDSHTWNNWTYDFTPEYKITPTDRVYFKYAYGVKSGGFNTAATNLASVATVRPEQLNDYEIGYKSEWLNGRLNFNADVFHYDYKDVQVNVVGFNALANTTVSYLQNAQQAHANGAEFEIEALPIENLHVNANLGLLDTKYDQFDILNNGGSLAGNQLVRAPHVTAQIAADYRIPLPNGGKVVLGADDRYVSKQFYYVTPQSDGRYLLNQDPYAIANARISYSTVKDKYTVTAYVNNVFDKTYENHALPAVAPGVTGDSVYYANPRTIGLSFIARF